MREILFHGKRNDNGEWIEGCYLDANNIGVFHDDTDEQECEVHIFSVDPETVGQYTCVNVGTDKLFEGDIVQYNEDYDDTWGYSRTAYGRAVVIWDNENFCWAFKINKNHVIPFNDWDWNSCYVVGNIHDNPELLK